MLPLVSTSVIAAALIYVGLLAANMTTWGSALISPPIAGQIQSPAWRYGILAADIAGILSAVWLLFNSRGDSYVVGNKQALLISLIVGALCAGLLVYWSLLNYF